MKQVFDLRNGAALLKEKISGDGARFAEARFGIELGLFMRKEFKAFRLP